MYIFIFHFLIIHVLTFTIIKAATPKSFDENAMDFEVAAMFFCAGLFDFDLHCDCFCQRIIISITCRRYFDFQLVRTLLQPLLYCNIASFADCDLLIFGGLLKSDLTLSLADGEGLCNFNGLFLLFQLAVFDSWLLRFYEKRIFRLFRFLVSVRTSGTYKQT